MILVLAQIIPALWFGLFSESWMQMNSLTEEEAMGGGVMPFIVSMVSSVGFAYMLAWVCVRMGVRSWLDGFRTALVMGFPIAILGTMTVNMFSIRPYALTRIDGGQQFLVWVAVGIILGGWTKKI